MARLPIGASTEYGEVSSIGFTGGERYYWLIDTFGVVSMFPASAVEHYQGTSREKGDDGE